MTRGRGGYSPRGSSYRGNSRGHRGSYNSPRGFSSFDSRSKYPSSERYSSSRNSKFDDYRKPFRPVSSFYFLNFLSLQFHFVFRIITLQGIDHQNERSLESRYVILF